MDWFLYDRDLGHERVKLPGVDKNSYALKQTYKF